jgi:hypothetical protein
MGFVTYESYLKSPTWHHIKQRVYEQKGRDCIRCKELPATQIHHLRYDEDTLKGKTLNYLIPVCRECHEKEHNLQEKGPIDARHDAAVARRRERRKPGYKESVKRKIRIAQHKDYKLGKRKNSPYQD